jgi:UDP-glucose 4-epimerase
VTSVICDAVARRVTADAPVNLAFGTRRSLLDVIAVLERVVDRELDRRHIDPRPGDVRDSQADNARLRALFPDVAVSDFEADLGATVDWFRAADSAP